MCSSNTVTIPLSEWEETKKLLKKVKSHHTAVTKSSFYHTFTESTTYKTNSKLIIEQQETIDKKVKEIEKLKEDVSDLEYKLGNVKRNLDWEKGKIDRMSLWEIIKYKVFGAKK